MFLSGWLSVGPTLRETKQANDDVHLREELRLLQEEYRELLKDNDRLQNRVTVFKAAAPAVVQEKQILAEGIERECAGWRREREAWLREREA